MQISDRRSLRSRGLAACALGSALTLPAASAIAAPAALNLRIEGKTSTIYEGPVTSDGHVVEPATGERRRCDGTNGGANPQPGPTPTSTLDDGAKLGAFTWDGQYFASFSDYRIDRVGPDSATSTQFWGQYVNSKAAEVGGCQQIVKAGDEVLWAYDAFAKQHVLRLAGPIAGRTNEPVSVRVTDGGDGTALAGASIGATTTGLDGTAQLSFAQPGIYRLKAERADSVRSNALSICIDPPGVESCTSTDRTAPRVRVALAKYASDSSSSRTFTVAWVGSDEGGGSGITGYDVESRRVGDPRWRPLGPRTALTRASLRGDPGEAYQFRITASDRAGNRGGAISEVVVVPLDDRDRRLRFSRGWRRLERRGAWERSLSRSSRTGVRARLRVSGSRFAIIGREQRRGGRLRMRILGRSKVIRLRGKPRHREVLYTSARLPRGTHTLKLEALDRAPVEIDAVAVVP